VKGRNRRARFLGVHWLVPTWTRNRIDLVRRPGSNREKTFRQRARFNPARGDCHHHHQTKNTVASEYSTLQATIQYTCLDPFAIHSCGTGGPLRCAPSFYPLSRRGRFTKARHLVRPFRCEHCPRIHRRACSEFTWSCSYVVVGAVVVGSSWYLARLARGPHSKPILRRFHSSNSESMASRSCLDQIEPYALERRQAG
jgi:hypothetical protein